MTQLEDSKIISLFFERSEQAIRELDCKYGSAVKKTAANILDDRLDVEECVDDTYMKVWDNIPPQVPNPLVGFVCKIARNSLTRWKNVFRQGQISKRSMRPRNSVLLLTGSSLG